MSGHIPAWFDCDWLFLVLPTMLLDTVPNGPPLVDALNEIVYDCHAPVTTV